MKRIQPAHVMALVVVLAGFALRAGGLDWRLPYQLDPDEPALFLSAAEIRASGQRTLKPQYPPLRVYELAAERLALEAVSGEALRQEQLFFFGRALSALHSVLLLGLAFQAGRALGGPAAGALAALFLAVEPASAELGRLIRADALAWLLALAALALAFRAAGRRSGRASLQLAAAFGCGLAAFLAKYNMLPGLAAPALVLLFRLVPDGRARGAVLAAGAALVALGIYLLRASAPVRAFLLDAFNLHRLLRENYDFAEQVQANSRLLLDGLGLLMAALALAGLVVAWARSRRSPAMRARLGAVAASAAVAAAIYTQADARFKDMYYLVLCVALLWAAGVAGLVELVMATAVPPKACGIFDRRRPCRHAPRHAASSTAVSDRWSAVGAIAAGVLLLSPWALADVQTLADLRRPDTRIATAEWMRLNVPEGARVACEYDCVELQAGYGGFPGPQPFHTEILRSAFERALDEYRANGIEYVIVDDRASGYFSSEPEAELAAGFEPLARFEAGASTGPQRAILRAAPVQQHTLYRWLGEAISFRGYDLPQTSVPAGGELALTLYWMSARATPADLIVFVHVVETAESQPLAGADGPPLGGAQPTWRWAGDMQFWVDERAVSIPADAPPGAYLVQIGMYDAGTGERLPVRTPDGQEVGTVVVLGSVAIYE